MRNAGLASEKRSRLAVCSRASCAIATSTEPTTIHAMRTMAVSVDVRATQGLPMDVTQMRLAEYPNR